MVDDDLDADSDLDTDDDETDQSGEVEVETSVHRMSCRRCRRQKLRCTRDLPVCQRCSRLSAVCTYPPPPGRQLWAHYKAQAAEISKLKESASEHSAQLAQARSFEDEGEDPEMASVPEEVALFLIDIYFSHQHDAILLFHKPGFVSDYAEGRVPIFVSLSMFAIASNIVQGGLISPSSENTVLVPSQLSMEYCSKYEGKWIAYASKRVLLRADDPTLQTIQTGMNLAHYWFYVGKIDRSNFYLHNAYRSCRVLGFQTGGSESRTLVSETTRRCFWACWQAFCVSQGNAPFHAECWKEVAGLSLPGDEKSFLAGNPDPREYFNEKGNVLRIDLPLANKAKPSYMAEMLKIAGLWCEIQTFVRRFGDESFHKSTQKVSTLLALDRRLELYFENLATCFRYDGSKPFISRQTDPHDLFALHCLYHLCCCVLHASVVPLFSNKSMDPMLSKKLSKMCTIQAVNHSSALLEMTNTFLSLSPQISRLSVTTGCSLYVVCCIQIKTILAQGEQWDRSISSCNGALLVLQALRETFRPLQRLWLRLQNLFSSKFDINEIDLVVADTIAHAGLRENEIRADKILSQISEPGDDTASLDLYTFVAIFKEEAPPTPPNSEGSSTPQSPSSPESAEESYLGSMGSAATGPTDTSALGLASGPAQIQQTPEQRTAFPHIPQAFEQRPELTHSQQPPAEIVYTYNTAVPDCDLYPFNQGSLLAEGFRAPASSCVPIMPAMCFQGLNGITDGNQGIGQQMRIPDQQNQTYMMDYLPFQMDADQLGAWTDEGGWGL